MKELLDVIQASEFLGMNEQTTRRLAREGKIPCSKVGGSWRFSWAELETWLKNTNLSINKPNIKKVMIVDDDPKILKNVGEIMTLEGFEVSLKKDGEEVIFLLPKDAPDLILLDINMPKVSGVETLSWIRENWGSIPVIIMTGSPDAKLAIKTLNYSPVTLIKKPIHLEKLIETAHQLCH